MNCCHGNNQNKDNQHKDGHNHRGHLSHMWMMALCCGAPILLLLLLPLLGKGIPGLRGALSGILPFMCPIMMLIMMPMMMRMNKGNEDSRKQPETRYVENEHSELK